VSKTDILDRLTDLHKQATTERSHYYTADAIRAAMTEIATLRAALSGAIMVADEARDEWDRAPSGMKAGQLLIALSGRLPGYRADIDAIHAVVPKKEAKP
jgi:hypothetical protein